jgi:hypothetical protein
LLLLELNEADEGLLAQAAARDGLATLERIVTWPRTTTVSPETVEHQGLDPWVQWVSVHTGVPLAEHGLRHLGESDRLRHRLLWERLADHGHDSIVWGPMNARRGTSACRLFVPDPWSPETAHPPELEEVLALPRYFAAHYGAPSRRRLATGALRLARAVAPTLPRQTWSQVPDVLAHLARHPHRHALCVAHDVVVAGLFADACRQQRPAFGLLFLNAVAHLQHHVWTADSVDHGAMRSSLRLLDRALADVLEAWDDADIVVMTGLSQVWREGKPARVLHRPRDPAAFYAALGVSCEVRPHMTNDAHLHFATAEAADAGRASLEAVRVGDAPLFDVQPTDDPRVLFAQLAWWTPTPDDAVLAPAGLGFHTWIEAIDVRTGDHVPEGAVWSSRAGLPERMANHEVASALEQWMGDSGSGHR